MKLITKDLVDSLDLIVASPVHPAQRQDIETIKLVGIDNYNQVFEEWKGNELTEVQIFATMMGYGRLFSYLSRGNPKKDERFMYGNRSVQRKGNSLYCQHEGFENSIDIEDIDNHSVYFGGHQWGQAIVFEKPLPFDPTKELMLVRSPNGSVTISDPLYSVNVKERIVLGDWMIINENGKREALEYDLTEENAEQQELVDRYFLAKYEKEIEIEEEAGKITLKVIIAPPLPAFEKTPYDSYQSIKGRDFGKSRRFSVENTEQLKDFGPLTFDPDHTSFREIKKGEHSKLSSTENSKDYLLIYASPKELLQGRTWAYNNAITGRNSYPAITRYNNPHLVK